MKKELAKWIGLLMVIPLIIAVGNAVIIAQGAEPANYRFINGNWFNGEEFKTRTLYSVDGVFSDVAPSGKLRTVDLNDGYVLPPFGDAHNHTLELIYNVETFGKKLISHGIFYVKNPNSVPRFTNPIRETVARRDTVDGVFANGGITGTDGHPARIYDEILAKGPFKALGITSYDGLAYHLINSEAELESKWPQILSKNPDFIKTYLLYSEEFEQRKDDRKYYGLKGLDPDLYRMVVKKAQNAGLRVSTHVNTAADFSLAVRAGVDEINHLPGRFAFSTNEFERYTLSEADVILAAKKGITVVPTYSLFLNRQDKGEEFKRKALKVQKENLRLLSKYKVRIALGPDSYNQTSQLEAFYLKDLGVFTNLEMIRMWSIDTPTTIFPKRKITKLENGYEASFIVVPQNPLVEFDTLKEIYYAFKQGYPVLGPSSP